MDRLKKMMGVSLIAFSLAGLASSAAADNSTPNVVDPDAGLLNILDQLNDEQRYYMDREIAPDETCGENEILIRTDEESVYADSQSGNIIGKTFCRTFQPGLNG